MSESNINLLNIIDADMVYTGMPVAQSELPHVGAVFTMPVPLCNSHLISKPMVVLHTNRHDCGADSTNTENERLN
jgi:hypothetical protein